jgi:D-amino-acid dehydrogenase
VKVVVLGSGVVGATTAYYLARAGAEVTVLDRQPGPALETSFGNAGQVSPGYSTPWAAPGIPLKALKWMFQKHAPLAVKPDGTLFQLRWIATMLRNCNDERYTMNKERMMRVAEYSRDCLQHAARRHRHRSTSTAPAARCSCSARSAARCGAARHRRARRVRCRLRVARPRCIVQPSPRWRRPRDRLVGGLRLPATRPATATCSRARLARSAQAAWASTSASMPDHATACTTASRITRRAKSMAKPHGRPLRAGASAATRASCCAAGPGLPVYPVKGYSLTVPIVDESLAPVSTVLDETYKIAITRFDDRIRIGGMAELGGFDLRPQATAPRHAGDGHARPLPGRRPARPPPSGRVCGR